MKTKILLLTLIATSIFSGCKKDDDDNTDNDYTCTTCVSSAEALPANDNSSAGVYKSVLLGSTGTVKIFIYNGNTNVSATVTFNNKVGTLTTTDLASWSPGQPINNAFFTGTVDGQTVSAYFSVGANGENPTVTCTIPGHSVYVQTYKELSGNAVKAFEGSYAGDDSGGLNILLNGNNFIVIVKSGNLAETSLVNGKVDFTAGSGTVIKGDFVTPDHLKGTWVETDGDKGTWEAKRTL
jgi:hypothetical protein